MNPPATATAAPDVATVHPLEPLSPEEISAAAEVVRRERTAVDPSLDGAQLRFVFITLREPEKAAVRAFGTASAPVPPREAKIVLRNLATKRTAEALVSLTDDALVHYEELEGVQASITAEEFMTAEDIVRADERWRAAMRARGIEDFDLCMLDPWSSSYTKPEDHPDNGRICRPLTWVRSAPGENGYARPVEGLVVTVDLDAGVVLDVEDHGAVPLPTHPGNYTPELMGDPANVPALASPRADLKPIEITQPEGASFTVDGHHVTWQRWDLRISFNPREGLVLHQVGYADPAGIPAGEEVPVRPVLYRASLSEMFIPYADPAPTSAFKNVFDMGEYGVGWLANPLELGCDCLGEIHYFDGLVNDQDGKPETIPNAVCMHEEDFGFGWKHTDFRTGAVEVRRSRRLVISFIATVGNYEYGYFWYLYTDGTIEYEVKLSGVLSTSAYDPAGPDPEYGTKLAPGLYGAHHQHFFSVRLDMEVDGPSNRVVEVDSEPVPMGPENPTGNVWRTVRTPLTRESEAGRTVDPMRARFWRVENTERVNGVGDPTAYKLLPGENTVPMQHPEGLFGRRGAFARKHLWVTPFAEREQFAGGEYPNQHPGGQGLPAWTAQDRAIDGEDLVVWYGFCAHHVVRPEDWPVMPVHHIGFKLKPSGFFDGNPALDLPRTEAKACGHGHGAPTVRDAGTAADDAASPSGGSCCH
jgi:primary-amine oxidase